MKKVKRLLTMAMATIMVTASLAWCGAKEDTGAGNASSGDKIKVGVFFTMIWQFKSYNVRLIVE